MNAVSKPKKKAVLTAELYKKNPLWFKGAVAYRLLRIMTPKPLTRKLPMILRRPLLLPGYTFPPDWVPGDPLPPGIIIPPDIFFDPGWHPGDPLPDGTIIDTSMLFPDTWLPGDPVPDFVILPPSAFFPPGWTTSDPLPDGLTIDPGYIIDPGRIFPIYWMLGDPIPVSVIFPIHWMLGDPIPASVILAPDVTMPRWWLPGRDLPDGTTIDTGELFPPDWQPSDPDPEGSFDPPDSFSDMPDIDSPVPPTYVEPPRPPGPVFPSRSNPGFAPPVFWEEWKHESLCVTHNWTLNIGVCGGGGLCIPIPIQNSVGDATAWLRIAGTSPPYNTYIYSGIQSMPTGRYMLQELIWQASTGDPGPRVDHFILMSDDWASTQWTVPPFATSITQNAVCISITDSLDNVCNLYFANNLDWNEGAFTPPDYNCHELFGRRVVANYDLANDYGLARTETIKRVRLWNTIPASSPASAIANGPRWMDFGPHNDSDWPGEP